MPVPPQNKLIMLMAEAIAHKEGFYSSNRSVRANRNNNPGNLRGWDKNNPKDKDGFDIFKTRSDGFMALYQQIEKNVVKRKVTFYEFFAGKSEIDYYGYAPETDGNNPMEYAKFVEGFLEDRGMGPISILHGIDHWWNELMGQGGSVKVAEIDPFRLTEIRDSVQDIRDSVQDTLNLIDTFDTD